MLRLYSTSSSPYFFFCFISSPIPGLLAFCLQLIKRLMLSTTDFRMLVASSGIRTQNFLTIRQKLCCFRQLVRLTLLFLANFHILSHFPSLLFFSLSFTSTFSLNSVFYWFLCFFTSSIHFLFRLLFSIISSFFPLPITSQVCFSMNFFFLIPVIILFLFVSSFIPLFFAVFQFSLSLSLFNSITVDHSCPLISKYFFPSPCKTFSTTVLCFYYRRSPDKLDSQFGIRSRRLDWNPQHSTWYGVSVKSVTWCFSLSQ